MSDIRTIHREAMEQTDLALEARLSGRASDAQAHFEAAYRLESQAAELTAQDLTAEPTRSVLLRSAASLALDCKFLPEAEKLIYRALAGNPPPDIAEELKNLLEQVTFDRHLKGRRHVVDVHERKCSGKIILPTPLRSLL